jgi:Uma2 family endonuclease
MSASGVLTGWIEHPMSHFSAIVPDQPDAAIPTEPIWRLTVEQYHAMINAGILTDDDPVELLDGWLVYKMPKNPAHRATTRLVRVALEALIPEGWYVDSQEPITTADSEPEPDVVVVQGSTRDYLDRHPGPADLAIVVEVSDATVQRDRTSKKQAYARSGIVSYWLVNLPERQVEVYTQPNPANSDYAQRQNYGLADSLPVILQGEILGGIAVKDILP